MKFRTELFTLIAAPCFCTTATASGIPVFDGAAALNFVQQMLQQTKDFELQTMQYQQLIQTYNMAVQQYKAMEGARGMGYLHHARVFESLVSSAYQQAMDLTAEKGYGFMSSKARTFYDKFNLGASCEHLTGDTLTACQNAQAVMAERAAALGAVDTTTNSVLDEVNGLMGAIDGAADIKAISDLNAQINAKVASLQVSSAKMTAQLEQMRIQQEAAKEKASQQAHHNSFKKLSDAELDALLR